jgi:hypothetical protein
MDSGDDSSYDPPEPGPGTSSGSGDEKDEGGDGESTHGSESSIDKKPKAIPRKATPPSSPDKFRKAAQPTSPRRTSPRRSMVVRNHFPYNPASPKTPEKKGFFGR